MKSFSVSSLVEWMKSWEIEFIQQFYTTTFLKKSCFNFKLNIPINIKNNLGGDIEYLENVSAITGIASISKYEIINNKTNGKLNYIIKIIESLENQKRSGTEFEKNHKWILEKKMILNL